MHARIQNIKRKGRGFLFKKKRKKVGYKEYLCILMWFLPIPMFLIILLVLEFKKEFSLGGGGVCPDL